MKQINILSVQALKEKLYVAFMRFVNSAIDNYEVLASLFAFYVDRFKTAYERLDDIYLKYDIDECTKAVNDADEVRDKAFRKLRDNLRMLITYPESEPQAKAANMLMHVIDLYGGSQILKLGITAKTAAYSNMVKDFETKFPIEVETAGVALDVQALKAAQTTLDEKYMARAVCESDFVKGAMVEARKETTDAYRLFVDAINVKVYETTNDQLIDFINLLNVEIGKYRTYTGQGQVDSTNGSNTDDEEGAVRIKTATFHFKNGNSIKLRVEVGAPLEAPANTEGYRWKPEVPELMPATNKTFTEVPIEAEQVTATFHFFDHTEEDIRQAAGTALVAPQNTTGYRWNPEVPAVMPAEDTAYYELPISTPDGGGNGENEDEYTPPDNDGGFGK